MRNFIKFILILLVLFLVSSCSVDEQTVTNLETETITNDEYRQVADGVAFSPINDEVPLIGISCFDVNEKGQIALGYNSPAYSVVKVIDSDGNFLYGFKFHTDGSFCLIWQGENIVVLIARSEYTRVMDSDANVIEMKKITQSVDNDAYIRYYLYSAKRKLNNIEYIISDKISILNIFGYPKSELIKSDREGNEKVIYQTNYSAWPQVLSTLLAMTCIPIVIFVVFKNVHNRNK